MYHIFIHSSIDRHLGCFHVLTIVNSAAMNIGVYESFQTMFFYRYMPRSEIEESYGSSILIFLKEAPILVSLVAEPIYIPINSVEGFPLKRKKEHHFQQHGWT